MDFRVLVWKRVWKITIFDLAAHPHQELPGVPSGYCGPKRNWKQCLFTFFWGGGGGLAGDNKRYCSALTSIACISLVFLTKISGEFAPFFSCHMHLNESKLEERNSSSQGYHRTTSKTDTWCWSLPFFSDFTVTILSLRRTPSVGPCRFKVQFNVIIYTLYKTDTRVGPCCFSAILL